MRTEEDMVYDEQPAWKRQHDHEDTERSDRADACGDDDGGREDDLRMLEPPDVSRLKDIQTFVEYVSKCTQDKKPALWGRWPRNAFILVRPEGYGKSSMIRDFVGTRNGKPAGGKVVFCAKSNAQLEDAHERFQKKWPELRIQRYVSKGQNLLKSLEALGVLDFKVVNYESVSPYAQPSLDEAGTLESIRTSLDAVGRHDVQHEELFRLEYTDYKAEKLDGLNNDVLMLTLAAFQAFSTSPHVAWWERFGLISGTRDMEVKGKEVKKNVSFHVRVIIDDPDRTDFDWRRSVTDEQAEILKVTTKVKTASPREKPEWWIKHKGHGPLTAQKLAEQITKDREKEVLVHFIEEYQGAQYERRPAEMVIGHNFRRGSSLYSGLGPKMIVTTTEVLTANYAQQTFKSVGLGTAHLSTGSLETTKHCHVTSIRTVITRKGNHALLIPIIEKLRLEFPLENVTLLADGLRQELNLSNSRGRDGLNYHSTIIKLSIPHGDNTVTLRAHFATYKELDWKGGPKTYKMRDRYEARRARSKVPQSELKRLYAQLLADACNQALGRNQGFRYAGKPAIVLIDPIYYSTIIDNGMLRYSLTPWSSHEPVSTGLTYHNSQTSLEKRLVQLLDCARTFGLSDEALELVQSLPERQASPFIEWRKLNEKEVLDC